MQIKNKFLAQAPTLTLKGNNAGVTGNVSDLTVAQVNAILPVFTSSLNGLAPSSGGGTTNFLRADGTWSAPAVSFSGLTTNGVIYASSSTTIASTSVGTSGYVLTSNGSGLAPTFQPVAGTVSAFFASSQITTRSTAITSATFTTVDNSPAFTFTPTITGTYKVYSTATLLMNAANNVGGVKVFNTSGSATLLYESQGAIYSAAASSESSCWTQSVYTLTAGTTYVFDLQVANVVGAGGINLDGQEAPFYMFAELEVNGTLPTTPSMRYYSSTTTISSTLSTIVYTTKDYDNNSAYSSGSYTIPSGSAGKYQINASLLISGTISLNNTLIMEIQKNGTVISRRTKYLLAGMTDGDIQISDLINCSASDTLRIQVSTSAVGPAIVSSNFDNYLSITKIN